jgi:FkbM family methyltransferase
MIRLVPDNWRKMSKLPLKHYVTNLQLVERNKEWLSSTGVSSKDKISYYGHMALSLITFRKKIRYLGSTFYYDNSATPLNLQNYPYEITTKILANMHKKPKTVLDIGGNLGQFSLTNSHNLKDKVTIDTFEPNSFVYEFLKKNTENKNNIYIYNYGLGDTDKKQVLYFNPTRTGIGSILKQNAGENAVMEQDVDITSCPKKLTKRKLYDLVKIDVEGYEAHAIKGLAGVSCEYLFVEFSGQTRRKDYMHSDMMTLLQKQWGQFDIYYCGGFGIKNDTFDMLIRFK